jgi:hypothetical protein
MMLQMGFENQVMQIVRALGPHQTLLFSATIPPAIEKMGSNILINPIFVAVGSVCTQSRSCSAYSFLLLIAQCAKCGSEADCIVGGNKEQEKEVI